VLALLCWCGAKQSTKPTLSLACSNLFEKLQQQHMTNYNNKSHISTRNNTTTSRKQEQNTAAHLEVSVQHSLRMQVVHGASNTQRKAQHGGVVWGTSHAVFQHAGVQCSTQRALHMQQREQQHSEE
jgi:hypothetical protein